MSDYGADLFLFVVGEVVGFVAVVAVVFEDLLK